MKRQILAIAAFAGVALVAACNRCERVVATPRLVSSGATSVKITGTTEGQIIP